MSEGQRWPHMRRFYCVLTLSIACGSGRADTASGVAVAELRHADSLVQAAIEARDADVVATFYSEDAVMLPMAEPMITGRDAIRAEWVNVFGIPGVGNSARVLAAEVSRDGDLGYTRGSYESPMLAPDGQPIVEHGKWVSVWRRQSSGQWRIVVDIYNTDSLPPDHQESTAAKRTP